MIKLRIYPDMWKGYYIKTLENVDKFGGNPSALTIGGMSAGGQSVQAHSTMAGSESLYDLACEMSSL